jgi:hypothetical protein
MQYTIGMLLLYNPHVRGYYNVIHLRSESMYIRNLECPGIIDLIDLTLRNIDRQHAVLAHGPPESLFSCRRPIRWSQQLDSVSLLNRKYGSTRVNDNRAVGRLVEGDDTKRVGRGQESVRP